MFVKIRNLLPTKIAAELRSEPGISLIIFY